MKQKREEEPHPQSYAETRRRNAKNNEGIETPRSRNAKSSEEDGIAAAHKKKIEEAENEED